MPELSLHDFHRFAARHRLAGHRMATHLMVTELAQSKLLLYDLEGSRMAVDESGEVPGLREQKLGPRVALVDVPLNGVEHILAQVQGVALVVLPAYQLGRPRLGSTLNRLVDYKLRRLLPNLPQRHRVHF